MTLKGKGLDKRKGKVEIWAADAIRWRLFFSLSDMNAGSTLKIVGVNLLGLKLDFLNLLLSSLSVINSYKIGSKSRS